jgi:CHAT domain-containing protein
MADPGDLADEYLGLTAGFLFAGAPAVVSTLWPVDDLATMFLMERFYQLHLHQRMSAAGALRRAQWWLRQLTAESVCRRLTAELKRFATSAKDSPQEEIVRSAQRTMSGLEPKRRPFDDPYYWAAFTMNGVCQTG